MEANLSCGEAVGGGEAEPGLVEMGGGGSVVDGDGGGGGDEAGELEELVEVAVTWKWYDYRHHWGFWRLIG